MQGRARAIASITALALLAAVATAPAATAKPLHLSFGDSWAFGFGASDPEKRGYAPVLWQHLKERLDCPPSDSNGCEPLAFRNVAIGGATTPSMMEEQFPEALPLLKSRNHDRSPRNDVEVITISIGGNDVVGPIIGACLGGFDEECQQTVRQELDQYRGDLDEALRKLRRAASSAAAIVLGTYDNPIPTCNLAGQFSDPEAAGNAVLEGGMGIEEGLHDVMRDVARDHDVTVASSFGKLGPDDWVGGNDCLHPDDSGYAKVAKAFLKALLA